MPNMELSGLDRRKMERFSLQLSARVCAASDIQKNPYLKLCTSNISACGAYFETKKQFSVGTKVKIEIILPADRLTNFGGRKSRIHLSGSVARIDDNGMALNFDRSYNIIPYRLNIH
ncbi:hypothetical protein PITCH_A1380045 [uncultured Desulfobacterium sp.]|uniref:PilZ domain-containing protein n=1 Tax=uncultured Desulfobacterium sp. TaxID=201089 RepID=A0A445MSQ6_9BACT|nr:hypothetical protein PITCH_A1380045 [uncultured Desulfobacterium sp.]